MPYDTRHEKTDLKVFVVAVPKEGWACMAAPITLKTGIPVEEGDCILKLLRRVSRPEIYFSSQEQIAYFLTQEALYILVHFKFLRVILLLI